MNKKDKEEIVKEVMSIIGKKPRKVLNKRFDIPQIVKDIKTMNGLKSIYGMLCTISKSFKDKEVHLELIKTLQVTWKKACTDRYVDLELTLENLAERITELNAVNAQQAEAEVLLNNVEFMLNFTKLLKCNEDNVPLIYSQLNKTYLRMKYYFGDDKVKDTFIILKDKEVYSDTGSEEFMNYLLQGEGESFEIHLKSFYNKSVGRKQQ